MQKVRTANNPAAIRASWRPNSC